MAETLFISLLKISAIVSAVGLIICVLSPVMNRCYTAKWKYYIWLILAIRLFVPVSVSLPTAPVSIAVPVVEYRVPVHTEKAVTPTETQPSVQNPQTSDALPEAEGKPATASGRTISLMQIAMLIWLLGAIIFLLWNIGCFALLKRKVLRVGADPLRAETIAAFETAAEQAGGRKVRLRVFGRAVSPMLMGFSRPVIVLPSEDYTEQELEMIFCHELMHLKRGDLWYKLLLMLSNSVHWFNPIVYLMAKNAAADLELCCDDAVARNFGFDERRAYSETILEGAAACGKQSNLLTTALIGGKMQMKRRIINLLGAGKKRNGAALLVVVALTLGLLGTMFACSSSRVPQAEAVSAQPSVLADISGNDAPLASEPQWGSVDSDDVCTHNLEGFLCKAEGSPEKVYLTSITLRENSATVTYLYGSSDITGYPVLPTLAAISSNGKEYPLTPVSSDDSAIQYSCENVPVADIKNLRVGDETPLLTAPMYFHPNAEDVLALRANDLPQMTYPELFAYTASCKEKYYTATITELNKRFREDPIAFAEAFYAPNGAFSFDTLQSTWLIQHMCGLVEQSLYTDNKDAMDAAVKKLQERGYTRLAKEYSISIRLASREGILNDIVPQA